ncbi:hypothetical protein [Carboxylicivirga sp. RSCT41]|uniref:hypothetical protein n=1 Tax=Carboxylicivirga agarovorans TaxID=3417570 RepID=UPI003D33FB63
MKKNELSRNDEIRDTVRQEDLNTIDNCSTLSKSECEDDEDETKSKVIPGVIYILAGSKLPIGDEGKDGLYLVSADNTSADTLPQGDYTLVLKPVESLEAPDNPDIKTIRGSFTLTVNTAD